MLNMVALHKANDTMNLRPQRSPNIFTNAVAIIASTANHTNDMKTVMLYLFEKYIYVSITKEEIPLK